MNTDRLNLGCGEFYAEGWCNVDTYDGNRVDLVADVTKLPIPDESSDRVYAGHVLEHLPEPDGVLAAVREAHRVLRPGGLFLAVGPDVRRGRAMLQAGQIDESQYDEILNSSGRWPGDDHLWPCHEDKMLDLIAEVFPDSRAIPVQVIPQAEWPIVSHIGWQCAVLAIKENP